MIMDWLRGMRNELLREIQETEARLGKIREMIGTFDELYPPEPVARRKTLARARSRVCKLHPRAASIGRVIRQKGRPLRAREIAEELARLGEGESHNRKAFQDLVTGTLWSGARNGNFKRVSRGVWDLGPSFRDESPSNVPATDPGGEEKPGA